MGFISTGRVIRSSGNRAATRLNHLEASEESGTPLRICSRESMRRLPCAANSDGREPEFGEAAREYSAGRIEGISDEGASPSADLSSEEVRQVHSVPSLGQ